MTYYKFKINLTEAQRIQINDTFEACSKIYFYLENLRIETYQRTKHVLTVNEMRNIIALEKRSSFFLRKADAQALVKVINDLPNVPLKLPPSKKLRFMKRKSKRSNVKYTTTVRRTGITIYKTGVDIPKLGEVALIEEPVQPVRVKNLDIFIEDGDYYIGYHSQDQYNTVPIPERVVTKFKLTPYHLLKKYPILKKCKDCPNDVQRHMTPIEEIVNELIHTHKEIYLEPLQAENENQYETTYLKEFYALLQLYAPQKSVKIIFAQT